MCFRRTRHPITVLNALKFAAIGGFVIPRHAVHFQPFLFLLITEEKRICVVLYIGNSCARHFRIIYFKRTSTFRIVDFQKMLIECKRFWLSDYRTREWPALCRKPHAKIFRTRYGQLSMSFPIWTPHHCGSRSRRIPRHTIWAS